MKKIKTVAIIGGGPSGCALATLLNRKKLKVGIFYLEKRPEIIVGESMLPAIVPMLRKLGVEDEVKKYSIYKPGASFWATKEEEAICLFCNGGGALPDYAYNVPRKDFDQTLFNQAKQEGVAFFNHVAKLEKTGNEDELKLSNETIAEINNYFDGQPDLIVDASGRSRTISRLLDIKVKEGKRKDVALFAHLENAEKIETGNIHLHRLEKGWAWRIPLVNKTSIGIVINPANLSKYGSTKEEQYDTYIKTDEALKKYTTNASRLTSVMQYNNYQLISQKMVGKNWLLIGDAGGFLDPIFSTGLYLALKSSFAAAVAIEKNTVQSFKQFEKKQLWELKVWQDVINTWYSGRLFTLYLVGLSRINTKFGRFIEPHMQLSFTKIFTGESVYTFYSRIFLKLVTKPLLSLMKLGGLHKRNVHDLEIK